MHLIHAGVGAALAGFGLWRSLAHLRRDRVVADTPLAHIRSAAQGYVKVSGRALAAAATPQRGPLTQRDCVWWDYKVAQEERDTRGNVHWRELERGTSVELFVLEDEDGARCLVGPVSAEVTPTDTKVWREGDVRYTERVLEIGTRLSVMGELRSHSEVGDVNAAALEKLRQWKQDQPSLLARFDANHDGRLDDAEWAAARAAAAQEAQAQTLSADIARTSVISAPRNGEPFLIAPLDTRQLEHREQLQAALWFGLGLLGVWACAWSLTHA